jgi:hypothetical protein
MNFFTLICDIQVGPDITALEEITCLVDISKLPQYTVFPSKENFTWGCIGFEENRLPIFRRIFLHIGFIVNFVMSTRLASTHP